MSFYNVEDSRCTRCGICVELCPTEVISFGEGDLPQVNQAQATACIKCGQCVIYCPTRASNLAFQNDGDMIRASELVVPKADAALNMIMTRRSVRHFKPEAITEADFTTLFDAVKMAPTAGNSQQVRWIVLQKPEKIKEVLDLIYKWFREAIFNEPTGRVGLVGARAIAQAQQGKDIVLRGAPNLIIAVTPKDYGWSEDGVIALTYVELAAHAMGLGCCWGGFLTTAIREYKPLREYLGIGEDEQLCGAQMIGYPEMQPTRQFPLRKKPRISWIK